jgi:hypothetical protein
MTLDVILAASPRGRRQSQRCDCVMLDVAELPATCLGRTGFRLPIE